MVRWRWLVVAVVVEGAVVAAVAARHLERGDLLLELRLVDDELDEAAAARRRRVVHLVDPVVVLAVALLDPRRLDPHVVRGVSEERRHDRREVRLEARAWNGRSGR